VLVSIATSQPQSRNDTNVAGLPIFSCSAASSLSRCLAELLAGDID
jgi:hypothetical protein